jgi:hypothetical protein
MSYRFLRSVCAAALMASGGQALAQPVSGSDTVEVSLSVDVSRSIELELGDSLNLTGEEVINEAFEGIPSRNLIVRKALATGCLSLTGVNDITVKVAGANQAPGGSELGFLKATVAAVDNYLHRYTVLSIAPPGADFSTMFSDSRKPIISPNINNGRFTMGGDQKEFRQDLWNARASVGAQPCQEAAPNIALGVMVGVDQGFQTTQGELRQYNSVSHFLGMNGTLADGSYVFTDTVTVEITPRM